MRNESGKSDVSAIIGTIIGIVVIWSVGSWVWDKVFNNYWQLAYIDPNTGIAQLDPRKTNKDECLNALHSYADWQIELYQYECGRACKYSPEFGGNICKEAVD